MVDSLRSSGQVPEDMKAPESKGFMGAAEKIIKRLRQEYNRQIKSLTEINISTQDQLKKLHLEIGVDPEALSSSQNELRELKKEMSSERSSVSTNQGSLSSDETPLHRGNIAVDLNPDAFSDISVDKEISLAATRGAKLAEESFDPGNRSLIG